MVEQGDQRRVVDHGPVGALSQDGGLHPVAGASFAAPPHASKAATWYPGTVPSFRSAQNRPHSHRLHPRTNENRWTFLKTPGGRSHEGRLMIAGAVEVFGENGPGCAELRRIMDQSSPTLKAFLEDATDPGTWIAADGWADGDGLENHTAIAVGDTPAHEVLEWIHRVFSNLKRRGLGVLHGFRRKHLDWQLVEWSFRWNWRQRRGESLFAQPGPGANPPRTAALHLNSHFAAGFFEIAPEAGRNGRIPIIPTEFLSPKARFRRKSTCCGCGLKAINHPQ